MQQGEERSSEIIFPADRTPAGRTTPRRETVLNAWLLSKRSANTRAAYANDLRRFFQWVDEFAGQLGTGDAFALRRVHLDGYRQYLSEQYAPSSVARRLTAVSSFYKYVTVEAPELLAYNPMSNVTRPVVSDESETTSLGLDEARRLFQAAREAGPMEHAIVGLLVTTGLRISEVVTADTTDLGRERGHHTISVTRKGGKRGKLPVPVEVADALRGYLNGRRGALFVGARDGQRLKRQQVDRVLSRLAEAARVPRVSPHGLRHTAATVALDAGQSIRAVQQLLGHRDPRTTGRYDRSRKNLDQSAVHTIASLITSV
jgi:site-specific recombinase XerD